jgi:uncharacterized protein (DUF1697 family)
MKKFIVFLRGINVGKIRIKMTDLQAAFESLGFESVKTYLQTGNVVFLADKDSMTIKTMLEEKLTQTFHYEAFVLVYEFDFLTPVISNYPMSQDEEHHAYVLFVGSESIFKDLESQSFGEEAAMIAFESTYQVVYWKTKIGQTLDTPFAKTIAKAKYKSTTTMRNLNTLSLIVK